MVRHWRGTTTRDGATSHRHFAHARCWLAAALLLALALATLPPLPAIAGGEDSPAVLAWGSNTFGELGNGLVGDGSAGNPYFQAQADEVIDLAAATAVAAGGSHSLALQGGTVWAWGWDLHGQLGDGAAGGQRGTPAQVAGLTGVIAIAAGSLHSLALKDDGTVWAWGNDAAGQLGDGTAGDGNRATPVQVSGITNVTAIAAGGSHSLALQGDGTVWAWGFDYYGQLGDGIVGDGSGGQGNRATPVQVTGLSGVTEIAAGVAYSLALKSDGTVWAWGRDNAGQLGDGTIGTDGSGEGNRATPVQVTGLAGVTTIAAGGAHGLALKGNGTAWTWGADQFGQLGDGIVGNGSGGQGNRATPVQVVALTNIVAIKGGFNHSVATKADGTAWAWGRDNAGQLGDGTVGDGSGGDGNRATPVQVVGVVDATTISAGGSHTLTIGTTITTATLTLETVGNGGAQRSPLGTGTGLNTYAVGTVVTITPQAGMGAIFTGWTVDGANAGWAPSLTITMSSSHTVQATFAPTTSFGDVGSGRADYGAIVNLASRGTIKGYTTGDYGPDQGVQRAQMAALIARAMPNGPGTPTNGTLTPPACTSAGTWDCEDWGNDFQDQSGTPAPLWRDAGTLKHYGVAFGYDGAACAARGAQSPCYAPTASVSYAETITFITRAMVAKGYWVMQPGAAQPYAGVPAVFTTAVATYHYYTAGAGGVQAPPADWNAGATRGWFARALWQALNTYWGSDGTLPDGRPAGGNVP